MHQWAVPEIFLGQHGAEQALLHPQAGQLRLDRPQVTLHIQPVRFAGLGHQVADVEPGRLAAADGVHQLGHQQIRQQ